MEKERRTKALLLSTLVVVVATLSIAFASLSRTLSINGIGKMDTASWSVYFDNLSNAKITRGAQEVGKPNISTIDNGILENINVKLSNPKDEISYTVDIVNDGTIDAEITMIKDIELTDVQKKVFEFKVTYTDTAEVLKDGDLLPAGKTKNITINIKFKDDITEFDLPSESQTINLSYQITYTQYDGNGGNLPVGPNGGATTEKAVLASVTNPENLLYYEDVTEQFFNCTTITRDQVESIDFLSSNIVPTEYADNAWDASEDKDGSVMAWYVPGSTEGLYKIYVGGNGGVYAPSDSSTLFGFFVSMNELNFNGNFNTSDVTNMSGMFAACVSLPTLDISFFNTTKVTDMSFMFAVCATLNSLDLSSFDTSNVTDMNRMISQCEALTSLNVSSFTTKNVTDMSSMFYDCISLKSLDISNFETPNLTNITSMFDESDYEELKLNSMSFENVEEYERAFANLSENHVIYVKDVATKNILSSLFSSEYDLNIIVQPLD